MAQSDLAIIGVLTAVAGFLARSLYDSIAHRSRKREDAIEAEAESLLREQRVKDTAKLAAQDKELQLIAVRMSGLEQESKSDRERFHELRGILQPLTNLTYALDKRLAVLETTVTSWQATLDRIELGLKELSTQLDSIRFRGPSNPA